MSSDLQFGFKAHRSTNMCTMILKETMAYYSSNNSSVFCSCLDATKAFDRVNYCKLFKLLIKRQLPAHVIRLLINMYSNNLVRIAWGGVLSDYFSAINGVKQGGVL
jgi:Reverse transcriptase (RNA-dependent DNA polymerase)